MLFDTNKWLNYYFQLYLENAVMAYKPNIHFILSINRFLNCIIHQQTSNFKTFQIIIENCQFGKSLLQYLIYLLTIIYLQLFRMTWHWHWLKISSLISHQISSYVKCEASTWHSFFLDYKTDMFSTR